MPPVTIEWYHERPADIFERECKVKGIGRTYAIPPEVIDAEHRTDDNLKNAVQLEHWVLSSSPSLQSLQEKMTAIVGANAELNDLRYNAEDAGELSGLLSGIASGFNPKDLQYWRDVGYAPNRLELSSGEFRMEERRKKVAAKTGKKIGWKTSPDTQDDIERQLGIDPESRGDYAQAAKVDKGRSDKSPAG
jgi:hypothetical protein